MLQYFTIEGIDFTGKTTQVELLQKLDNESLTIIREPGATKLGSELREIILNTEMSDEARDALFVADRMETLDKVILPTINNGKVVLSDRSFISWLAYKYYRSEGIEQEDDFKFAIRMFGKLFPGLSHGDRMVNVRTKMFVILLTITESDLVRRISKAGSFDMIENVNIEDMIVRQVAYKKILKDEKLAFVEIDACQSVEAIHKEIKKIISDNSEVDFITTCTGKVCRFNQTKLLRRKDV
jgi:dTMP kinase